MYCFGLQIHSMHNGFLSKIGKEAGKNTQIFGLAMGEGEIFLFGLATLAFGRTACAFSNFARCARIWAHCVRIL